MVHGMTKCENIVEGKFDPKYLLGINNTYINILLYIVAVLHIILGQ